MTPSHRLTRKQAIITFCRECQGWDGHRGGTAGTPWKAAGLMVRQCPDKACPLWPYRTGSAERGLSAQDHQKQGVSHPRNALSEAGQSSAHLHR